MCKFFSLASDGKGNIFYFGSKARKQILSGKLKYETDSHTSIADYFGYKGADEDRLNKYEYNPLTREFTVDQLNTRNDSKVVEEFCNKLDFSTVVPELICHPIVHPFRDVKPRKRITKGDLLLLKEWDSVRDSIRDSIRNSVGDSVWDYVWRSVRDSVRSSVGSSVCSSVEDFVRNSVCSSITDSVWRSIRDSVGISVWSSVGDFIGAYITSFFNLKKWKDINNRPYENPFQSSIDLWNKGIVPSFDGETWRLHTGPDGKIIKELERRC